MLKTTAKLVPVHFSFSVRVPVQVVSNMTMEKVPTRFPDQYITNTFEEMKCNLPDLENATCYAFT